MSTLIVLIVYIAGVHIAYFQLLKWTDPPVSSTDEFKQIFQVSLLSWFIYPVYGLIWLLNECEEE